ncbi:MAG: hypothetical protein M3Q98_02905, partial [Actinomycetota bacterium]|nr:hypothetical protein [Actinomycetota bacterium]
VGLSVLLSTDMGGATARVVRGNCASGVTPYLEFAPQIHKGLRGLPVPASEVLDIAVTKSGRITLVGLDDACNGPYLYTLEPGGFAWVTAFPDQDWYLTVRRGRIHTPGGDESPGCSRVATLSVLGGTIARVACTDGTLFGTMNNGNSWKKLGTLPDLRAVDYSSPSVGVALARFEGCPAQAFLTRDGGKSWTKQGCINGSRADTLAFNGLGWVAQVSGVLYVSLDYGKTWSPSIG